MKKAENILISIVLVIIFLSLFVSFIINRKNWNGNNDTLSSSWYILTWFEYDLESHLTVQKKLFLSKYMLEKKIEIYRLELKKLEDNLDMTNWSIEISQRQFNEIYKKYSYYSWSFL